MKVYVCRPPVGQSFFRDPPLWPLIEDAWSSRYVHIRAGVPWTQDVSQLDSKIIPDFGADFVGLHNLFAVSDYMVQGYRAATARGVSIDPHQLRWQLEQEPALQQMVYKELRRTFGVEFVISVEHHLVWKHPKYVQVPVDHFTVSSRLANVWAAFLCLYAQYLLGIEHVKPVCVCPPLIPFSREVLAKLPNNLPLVQPNPIEFVIPRTPSAQGEKRAYRM